MNFFLVNNIADSFAISFLFVASNWMCANSLIEELFSNVWVFELKRPKYSVAWATKFELHLKYRVPVETQTILTDF